MNREIRFRAWDSHSKQMITDVLAWTRRDGQTSVVLPHGLKSEKAYAVVGDHWKNDNFGNQYSDLNVVIPMQYTGLKDKNGVEIFEGDILNNPSKSRENNNEHNTDDTGIGFSGDVAHSAWWGIVSYQTDDDNCLAGFKALTNHGNELMFKWSACEVIGNIYTTPELLNPKGGN